MLGMEVKVRSSTHFRCCCPHVILLIRIKAGGTLTSPAVVVKASQTPLGQALQILDWDLRTESAIRTLEIAVLFKAFTATSAAAKAGVEALRVQ